MFNYYCSFCYKKHNIYDLCQLNIKIKKYKKYNKQILLYDYLFIIFFNKLKHNKIFICERCNKEFNKKDNLIYHNNNKVCVKQQLCKIIQEDEYFKCSYCNKNFTHLRTLKHHIKYICKEKNINLSSKILNSENNINSTNINNIHNANNTTNNIVINNIININNLVPFRETPYEIDIIKMKECLANPYLAIDKIINNIHFNQNNPQNMNIINSNRRDDSVKVYDYNSQNELGWITQNKNTACELLHNKSVGVMLKIPTKLKLNNINVDLQKEFNLSSHISNLEYNKEIKKESIKRIKNLIYDKHKMVLLNKKKLDDNLCKIK